MPGTMGRPLTIVACIKFTVDVSQLRPDPVSGRPNLERASWRISTFDENAIEESVRLTERHGGQVIGVTFAEHLPPRDVILKALAMGLDALYAVRDPIAASADAFVTSTILAGAIRKLGTVPGAGPADVIICGEGSEDDYSGQVGPRLAEALEVPSATCVTRVAVDDSRLRVDRAMEDEVRTLEAPLPALVTVGMETNQPRMPTVLQIMGAGRKPVTEWSLADLAIPEAGRLAPVPVTTTEVFAPPSARRQIVVEGETAGDVARKLLRYLGDAGEVHIA